MSSQCINCRLYSHRLRAQILACSILLPDFSIFTVADTATAGVPLSWGVLGSMALIAAAYMLLHLLVATWIFAHKEF